jgi:signal peptidase I
MTRKQLCILLAVALFALAFRFTFVPVLISGASMEPTLHSGALRLMIRRHSAALPPRFQIVLVRAGGELLVKRVIAFPGEWVSMTNGVVFINGTALAEPFPLNRGSWTVRAGPISPGKVLLIGDNRELPFQSFFVVPLDAIVAQLHASLLVPFSDPPNRGIVIQVKIAAHQFAESSV